MKYYTCKDCKNRTKKVYNAMKCEKCAVKKFKNKFPFTWSLTIPCNPTNNESS